MFKIKALVSGVFSSLIIFVLLLSAISLISLKTGVMSDGVYFWFSSTALCVAMFSGGFVSGKVAGERVAVYGLAAALLNSALFSIFLFLVFKSDFSVFLTRAALIAAASVAGAVVPALFKKESKYV